MSSSKQPAIKLVPYLDALLRTDGEKKSDEAPLKANETKAELDLKIAQLNSALSRAMGEVQRNAAKYPLNLDTLVASNDTVRFTRYQRDFLVQTKKQLFPED